MFSSFAEVAFSCRLPLFRLLEFLREQLHVTPHDRERIAEIVDKFRRGLAERSQPLFLRELFQKSAVQLPDFGGCVLPGPKNAGAFDIAADHVPHFCAHQTAC